MQTKSLVFALGLLFFLCACVYYLAPKFVVLKDSNQTLYLTFKPVLLDRQLVTVAEFAKYVNDTGLTTFAEKEGGNFLQITDPKEVDTRIFNWVTDRKYFWRQPSGQALDLSNHPVTQLTYYEAKDYCAYVGKRLPTERDWDIAASNNGLTTKSIYPWGTDSLYDQGGHKLANTWDPKGGNQKKDDYLYTSPVNAFPPSVSGVFDMVGNVWQYTDTLFDATKHTIDHPMSLESIVSDDNIVLRGGSFLCHTNSCHGFSTIGRNTISKENATFHIGFRCASDPSIFQIGKILLSSFVQK